MLLIDKKGRLFGVLNILDLIVLILIAGAVISFAYRTANSDITRLIGGNDVFYVTFRIERVREYSVNAVNIGDIMYEQFAAKLGEVVDVYTGVPHETVSLNDGTSALFPMEGRFDLYITIKAAGTANSDGYYIGGNNHIAPGRDIKIQSNMVTTTARVHSISEEY